MTEEESRKGGKQKPMEPVDEEPRRAGKRRQTESVEEESEWRVRVERWLGRIEELLEGLGPQIAAFQEALSILAGKIPNEDPYGDGKKEKEKEGEDEDIEE